MSNTLIRVDQKTTDGAGAAVQDFSPSDEVKAILQREGVNLYPANTNIGDKAVTWRGRGYVLPAEPTQVALEEASKALAEKAKEENQAIRVYERIDAMPWDGAQAFARAIEDLFGWGISRPTPGLFGPNPPVIRSIKTGPGQNDVIQVLWGAVEIPQMKCILNTTVDLLDNRLVFCIGGEIRKSKRHILDQLVALTRVYARERSIYKGKAIRMFVDEEGDLDFDREPEFLDTNPAVLNELVFTEATRAQIETNLFTPIRHSEVCREMNIPLKRGVLFAGPYGTGKSMTAKACAALAVQNGWTFIMINRVSGLQAVLDFAHRYAPVVVFAEDVDRVVSGDERTVSIDDVLNTLDGVQSKNHDVITVLTSNHAEKINRAMLRPGRLDAIITIDMPDGPAAERLMRMYSAGLIREDEDLSRSREALAGRIPAVIREAVERAKLSAVAREGGRPTHITDDDLVIAAKTMETHLGLLYAEEGGEESVAERLGKAMIEAISGNMETAVDEVHALVDGVNVTAQNTLGMLSQLRPRILQTHERVMTVQQQVQQK